MKKAGKNFLSLIIVLIFIFMFNEYTHPDIDIDEFIPQWTKTAIGLNIDSLLQNEEIIDIMENSTGYLELMDSMAQYSVSITEDIHYVLAIFGTMDFSHGASSPEFVIYFFVDYDQSLVMQSALDRTGLSFTNFGGISYISDIGPENSPFNISIAFPDDSLIVISSSNIMENIIYLLNNQINPLSRNNILPRLLSALDQNTFFWAFHEITNINREQLSSYLEDQGSAISAFSNPIEMIVEASNSLFMTGTWDGNNQVEDPLINGNIQLHLEEQENTQQINDLLSSMITLAALGLQGEGNGFYSRILQNTQLEENNSVLNMNFSFELSELNLLFTP